MHHHYLFFFSHFFYKRNLRLEKKTAIQWKCKLTNLRQLSCQMIKFAHIGERKLNRINSHSWEFCVCEGCMCMYVCVQLLELHTHALLWILISVVSFRVESYLSVIIAPRLLSPFQNSIRLLHSPQLQFRIIYSEGWEVKNSQTKRDSSETVYIIYIPVCTLWLYLQTFFISKMHQVWAKTWRDYPYSSMEVSFSPCLLAVQWWAVVH